MSTIEAEDELVVAVAVAVAVAVEALPPSLHRPLLSVAFALISTCHHDLRALLTCLHAYTGPGGTGTRIIILSTNIKPVRVR